MTIYSTYEGDTIPPREGVGFQPLVPRVDAGCQLTDKVRCGQRAVGELEHRVRDNLGPFGDLSTRIIGAWRFLC